MNDFAQNSSAAAQAERYEEEEEFWDENVERFGIPKTELEAEFPNNDDIEQNNN